MECSETLERMMLALDGELPPEEWRMLESHLEACAPCRAQWERLQAVERVLQRAPLLAPPPGFAERVMARVDRRRAWRRNVLGGLALAMGTAVVILLGLLPGLWTVPGVANFLAFLVYGGDILLGRLSGATRLFLDSLQLLLRALLSLALPLAFCNLVLALALGILWLGIFRHCRPMRIPANGQ